MNTYRFEALIRKHEGMDAAYIEFPYDVMEAFGTKGQVKVKAVFDETVEYRGSLAKMGMACHCLGMPKKIREQLGKSAGHQVNVSIQADTEPRVVDIPDDLMDQLSKNRLEEAFRTMSYTKQKEAIEAILNAKKPETRTKRIVDVVERLAKRND